MQTVRTATSQNVEGPGESSSLESEVEKYWWSYSGRTMIPGMLGLLVLTIIAYSIAWYLGAWRGQSTVRYAIHGGAVSSWLAWAGCWFYRKAAMHYRLTSHRLLVQTSFRRIDNQILDLKKVNRVAVARNAFERLLGVGHIVLYQQDRVGPPSRLTGLRDPEHKAIVIRNHVQQLRGDSG